MNRKRIVAIAVVAVLAAGVAWWVFNARRSAHRDDTLVLYGNVDIRDVAVGFRVAGRLAAVDVDEGDAVVAGQVLARLDDEPYRHEMREAEASLASITARLDLLRAGSRKEDIAQAQAQVDEGAAALNNAQRNLDRQELLKGSGASSQRQYDDARSQRDQSAASLRASRQALARARNGNREQEVRQAQADAARAMALLAQSRLKLEDTVLKAPSAGIVMTRATEPGAILPSGATVFGISLVRPVYVRAYVREPDLGRVQPGRKVYVRSDSRPDHWYEGTVGYVSPTAEFTPKSVETTDLRTDLVYRLRIVVRDPDAGLRQGMPVTAEMRFADADRPNDKVASTRGIEPGP